MNLAQPEVTTFLDLKEYLVRYYEWRKTRDHKFSYATWAGELNIKSKSHLRFLVIGKRSLTERLIPLFIDKLEFDKREARYFELLVRYTQAHNLSAREQILEQLKKIAKKTPELTRIHDAKTFLSSRFSARLQILLTQNCVERSIPNLSKLLRTTPSEVRLCLELLERLGLAEKNETSSGVLIWKSKVHTFDIPDSADDESLRLFHLRSLEEAVKAVELPRQIRKFDSVFAILSETDYARMTQEISNVVNHFIQMGSSSSGHSRLYQINLNLIPVSEPFHQSENTQPRYSEVIL